MRRKLLIWGAVALPVLLWLASVPAFVAMYGPPFDMWGLLNGLIVIQWGIPLAYVSIPVGLIGTACALLAMCDQPQKGPLWPMSVVFLVNLGTAAVGGSYVYRLEMDKTKRQARTQQVARLTALRDDLLAYAANHHDQLPEHLLYIRSVRGLTDEAEAIDVPGWSPVSEPDHLDHPALPAQSRRHIANWVRTHGKYIYLGEGLSPPSMTPKQKVKIVLVIIREPVRRLGYPVLTLGGGVRFLSQSQIVAALKASNDVRASIDATPNDVRSVRDRLR